MDEQTKADIRELISLIKEQCWDDEAGMEAALRLEEKLSSSSE